MDSIISPKASVSKTAGGVIVNQLNETGSVNGVLNSNGGGGI